MENKLNDGENFCSALRVTNSPHILFGPNIQGTLKKDPSFKIKQKVLRLVVDRIIVEDKKIVIHHIIPANKVRLQTGGPAQNTPLWTIVKDIVFNFDVSYARVLTFRAYFGLK